MRFALLLSTQRSGTNLLRRILGSNPEIDMLFGEILDATQIDNPLSFYPFLLSRVAKDPKRCLPGHRLRIFENYLKTLEIKRPEKIKILDIKYNSLHHLYGWWSGPRDTIVEFWEKNDIPVIHLIRKSIPRTIVSLRVAEHSGVWVSQGEGKRSEPLQVHIDPDQLLEDIDLYERDRAVMRNRYRRLPKYVEVYYEDIMDKDDPARIDEATFGELAEFLGVNPEFDREAPINKIITSSLQDKIANYDEVTKALVASGRSWDVEESLEA